MSFAVGTFVDAINAKGERLWRGFVTEVRQEQFMGLPAEYNVEVVKVFHRSVNLGLIGLECPMFDHHLRAVAPLSVLGDQAE